jgi:hypothetical protein
VAIKHTRYLRFVAPQCDGKLISCEAFGAAAFPRFPENRKCPLARFCADGTLGAQVSRCHQNSPDDVLQDDHCSKDHAIRGQKSKR